MSKKLFIFDLDGTFYNIGDLIAFNFQQQAIFLSEKKKISLEKAKEELEEHHIYSEVKEDAKSCSEYFQSIGLDMDEWNRIRTKDFPIELIQKNHSVNQEILNKYKEKGILCLVSNNTLKNVDNILSYLKIDMNSFSCIVSKESQGNSKNKMNAYQNLMKQFDIPAQESIAIGDRYNIDVLPLLNLKGSGVVVNGPQGVKDFIEENCNSTYKIYHSL